ncbi:MAG: M23 family metallopeptidase [Parabacteroides sp.]|nr:M23 family metallopeptidase [Parabacteroides sp.]
MFSHIKNDNGNKHFVKQDAVFPKSNIPLPNISDLTTFLPESLLDTIKSPKKSISETLSARDINHVSVQDPKRFADGNTEIIDLSAIQAEDYAFPLPGAKTISPYGGRRRHHSGYDIKTKANDTIVAAFDGIVRMSKPYSAYGNVIVIRHYNGLETVYSHNSKNMVKPGDKVKAGEPIALTGRTGRATTEHLHFEVRFNGIHFNPNYVFNFRTHKLRHNYLICKRKGNSISVSPIKVKNALLSPDVVKEVSNKHK